MYIDLKEVFEKRKLFVCEEYLFYKVVWNVFGNLFEIQGEVFLFDGN